MSIAIVSAAHHIELKNYHEVCRLAVKTIIDRSCFDSIDDTSYEFINFASIIDHIFHHRIKGPIDNKRNAWSVVTLCCKKMKNNCLKNVTNLEHLSTPISKFRAWFRLTLMEKRLTEYLQSIICERSILEKFYHADAYVRSSHARILVDTVMGLAAIDFSFDLRNCSNLNMCILPIDYTPYLQFNQSAESILDDLRECHVSSHHRLTNAAEMLDEEENANLRFDSECPWREKHMRLEDLYKVAVQQKGYLEELTRVQEVQFVAFQKQHVESERVYRHERSELENCILELQVQLTLLQEQYSRELQSVKSAADSRKDNLESTKSFHRQNSSPPRTLEQVFPSSRLQVGRQELDGVIVYQSPTEPFGRKLRSLSSPGAKQQQGSSSNSAASAFDALTAHNYDVFQQQQPHLIDSYSIEDFHEVIGLLQEDRSDGQAHVMLHWNSQRSGVDEADSDTLDADDCLTPELSNTCSGDIGSARESLQNSSLSNEEAINAIAQHSSSHGVGDVRSVDESKTAATANVRRQDYYMLTSREEDSSQVYSRVPTRSDSSDYSVLISNSDSSSVEVLED